MESALNNVGIKVYADEVFRDIAENRLPVWIDELQTADAQEVRHGRWVKHLVPTDFDGEVFNVEHIVCSVCEAAIPLNSTYKTKWYSDYCPSCGAKMEGEEE